ncbi:CWF19-like protein 1 [Eurytemora carolleeae]|uniref:CWF19-like protein 1 n=1 Tax=Eurytemora carolleeae TaxID=1294199 RepID=UPI000C77470D|nr:CWF19-like protein 1 [Eurytemora carolleeae]|eukprot:XP_023341614.1 CWF19-like protein 1 [Eurytemora affinis]
MSLKILVSGDAEGNLASLFKKVEAVNKKAGPFEMLLCVGSFFGPGNLGWQDYKTGRCKVPIPVYILGKLIEYLGHGGWSNEKVRTHVSVLQGRSTRSSCSLLLLRPEFLGGDTCPSSENSPTSRSDNSDRFKISIYSLQNLQALEGNLRWDDSRYPGVDILLTSDWPKGISNRTRASEVRDLEVGSALVSRLALLSRPRYHFCGLHGEHYERTPYRNHQTGAEQAKPVTRFIALGKVGNKEKKKWLYAFNITPLKNMERAELVAQPVGVTEIPFLQEHIEIQGEKKQQFFFDMNAKMEDEGKGKKRKNDGEDSGRKAPVGPCWFCLSSPEVEKHLIVSVGEHSYLALAKGALTPDHVMILPIGHHQCLVNLPEEVSQEIDKFKSALRKMFKKNGKAPVFFERNFKCQHLQLQVVPVIKDDATVVKKEFLDQASSREMDLNEIPSHVPIAQLAVQGQPYFFVETPNKDKLFGRIDKGFPLQFGREVLCCPSLLDMEERADWKACKLSQEEEMEHTKEFRKLFSPFDFTLE